MDGNRGSVAELAVFDPGEHGKAGHENDGDRGKHDAEDVGHDRPCGRGQGFARQILQLCEMSGFDKPARHEA